MRWKAGSSNGASLDISSGTTLMTNRREFLRMASACSVATSLLPSLPAFALNTQPGRKLVIVTFGGGARDEETFAPEGHENIPCMLKTLVPQSTFYGQVVNRGILGHYVATSSLATGVYETFNNFSGVAPDNPTIFEYFRKGLNRPREDAWVISPNNGFRNMRSSSNGRFGAAWGAELILPKQLLRAASPNAQANDFEWLLRDAYEQPQASSALPHDDVQLMQLERALNLSAGELTQQARTLGSADELSVYIARKLMTQLAPSLLWITLHDVDVAHSGAYSLYIEGIQRTDRLCLDIWNHIQATPAYAGKTTMLILPDFGRDSDMNPNGNGFQHHRTGDAASRTTWMMALGQGVREGVFIERAVESTDLVPTVGKLLGVDTPASTGRILSEVV